MSEGLRVIKENNNLAKWSRQVEECRGSGLHTALKLSASAAEIEQRRR